MSFTGLADLASWIFSKVELRAATIDGVTLWAIHSDESICDGHPEAGSFAVFGEVLG